VERYAQQQQQRSSADGCAERTRLHHDASFGGG
jgi:hypothetical protein